jgi:hypothetical protein
LSGSSLGAVEMTWAPAGRDRVRSRQRQARFGCGWGGPRMWSATDATEPWHSCRDPAAKRCAAALSRTATMSDRSQPSDGPDRHVGHQCLCRRSKDPSWRCGRLPRWCRHTTRAALELSGLPPIAAWLPKREARCRRCASTAPPPATDRETGRALARRCGTPMPDPAKCGVTSSAMSLPIGLTGVRAAGTSSFDRVRVDDRHRDAVFSRREFWRPSS